MVFPILIRETQRGNSLGKLFDITFGRLLLNLTDGDIIKRYQQQQDTKYIAMLIDRYSPQISGISFRYFRNTEDVKDFSADLFIKLAEKLQKLDTNDREDFGSWMTVFVRNAVIDQMRKQNSYQNHTNEFGLQAALSGEHQEDPVDLDPDRLQSAIEQLPEQERLCIEAIYLREETYQSLMKEHGFTFNQVRGYRDRGIKHLREFLPGTLNEFLTGEGP